MATLKCWVIAKVIGSGEHGDAWRPSLSDDFPEIEWNDILFAQPPYVPAVTISRAICQGATALNIHQNVRSKVLAAEELVGEEWVDFVYQGVNWGKDAPFTEARWEQIRDGLVVLGVDENVIDTWWSNYPGATPRDFYLILKQYLGSQG